MRYTIRGGLAVLSVGGCYYLWQRNKRGANSSKKDEPITLPQVQHVEAPPEIPAVPAVTMEPNFPQVPVDTKSTIKQDRGIFEGTQLKRRIYPWN